jgi:hypothetical protein
MRKIIMALLGEKRSAHSEIKNIYFLMIFVVILL